MEGESQGDSVQVVGVSRSTSFRRNGWGATSRLIPCGGKAKISLTFTSCCCLSRHMRCLESQLVMRDTHLTTFFGLVFFCDPSDWSHPLLVSRCFLHPLAVSLLRSSANAIRFSGLSVNPGYRRSALCHHFGLEPVSVQVGRGGQWWMYASGGTCGLFSRFRGVP